MSWDKNTISMSHLDAYQEVLEELGIPYKLTVKRRITGRGCNDSDNRPYALRRLEYRHFVILEHIEQTADCDMDDVISSTKFLKEDEPQNWQYVVQEVAED